MKRAVIRPMMRLFVQTEWQQDIDSRAMNMLTVCLTDGKGSLSMSMVLCCALKHTVSLKSADHVPYISPWKQNPSLTLCAF